MALGSDRRVGGCVVWGGSYGEVEPDQGLEEPDRLRSVNKLLSIFEPWFYHP